MHGNYEFYLGKKQKRSVQLKRLNLTLFLLFMLIAAAAVCSADGLVEVPMMRHPADDRPQLPDYLPDKPGKGLTLPPAPSAPDTIAGAPTFELKGLIFKGNTVISEEELLKVADTFVRKKVGIADLEELRYRLTRLYVDRGYINSGAVLEPDQTVDNGIVSYLIREGHLDGINITGNGRLKKGYIKKRIWSGKEKPFNVSDLQDRFQLLLQNPLIEKMNGRIRPGLLPGQAFLDLDVVRTRPYGFTITADNYRTPSTGAEGLTAAGTIWNLTGLGDRLDASLGFSEGVNEFAARFTLPQDAQDTRVSLGFSINDNAVIEEPLASVDIESDLKNIEINLTHPFVKTLEKSFEMGVTLARRESQTLLDGHGFSFDICSENGKNEVTALRFIQSYAERNPFMAMTLRSTISFGTASAAHALAKVLSAMERGEEAYLFFQEAFEYTQQHKDLVMAAGILRNLAHILTDNARALEKLNTAWEIVQQAEPSREKMDVLLGIGAEAEQRKTQAAARLSFNAFHQALTLARDQSDIRGQAQALGGLAELYESLGQLNEAEKMNEQALVNAQALQAHDLLMDREWQMGRLLKAKNDPDRAVQAFRRAVYHIEALCQHVSINSRTGFFFIKKVCLFIRGWQIFF
ncbi:MAG: POTRA domain-containing protein [Thermodesulfobacteriota bacterium]|nr:POTRA domain-containing protein [Thermodesulfobacteriota bacterium]